ncbi:GFA family protein, partial [Lysobacter sp. 2RAB21]
LSLTCEGDPVRVSACHCLCCRRRTGSAFGWQARFPREAVAIQGESREYVRQGDSGSSARFGFCPNCGSTVYWRAEGLEAFVTIAVGAFAEPDFPPPWVSVYDDRRSGWIRMPEGCEILD